MTNPRAAKVADRIQEIVASMLGTQIKDPRLGMVTITDVKVTGDLQHADIFYTVLGSEENERQSGQALESAKGMIRSNVGKQLGLRLTPSLAFHADALPESAKSIEDLLTAARFRDDEIRRSAEGAQPAGDADPYRKPRDVEEDSDDDGENTTELTVSTAPGAAVSAEHPVAVGDGGIDDAIDPELDGPQTALDTPPTPPTPGSPLSPASAASAESADSAQSAESAESAPSADSAE